MTEACSTCGKIKRNPKESLHCWNHGQCRECHYLGLTPEYNLKKHAKRKCRQPWQDKPLDKYNVKVTDKNIDLYCRLSKIIRGKPCKNPKLVIARQSHDVLP